MAKEREHHYAITTRWTGNTGRGTADYRAYERRHEFEAVGKPAIAGSADPAFRGDAARHNPEEMLVAALSGCHMLWYLHLCAEAGVAVMSYIDRAEGLMHENADGSGRFVRVMLRPEIEIIPQAPTLQPPNIPLNLCLRIFVVSIRSPSRPLEFDQQYLGRLLGLPAPAHVVEDEHVGALLAFNRRGKNGKLGIRAEILGES
jgi:organic hydroperoxide reductase OsmC/OhrA